MARLRDWLDLGKNTFTSISTNDMTNLYALEWPETKKILIAEHRIQIDDDPKRIRRKLRTASAILYGLVKRLAPHRRLVFVFSFFFFFVCLCSLAKGMAHPPFWIFFQITVMFLIMTLLLAMELIDKIKFRDELQLARDLQASLIPKEIPVSDTWDVAAFNSIANTVGGDIYDFVPLDDGRLAVLFGDASGHGMAAGLVMAVTHAAFRTQIETEAAPDAVMARLNGILCRTGACRTGGPRQFFAGVALLLAPGGAWEAVVAGHPPILKIDSAGGILERIGKGSYPAGVKESTRWSLETGCLAPGETLLLHSDGLAECRDVSGAEFGDPRIEAVIARRAGASAPELSGALAAAFSDFLGRRAPEDDVSIAAIRRR